VLGDHGPEGDIIDLYTTLPWSVLCDEEARKELGTPKVS